jgi:formamidopyrimidine-DNA glycosylase
MPELPEVETVVRSIRPFLAHGVIRKAVFHSGLVTKGDREQAANELQDRRIHAVRRLGKHILIELDRGLLHIHLGMTGQLLWNGSPGPYTRAVFELQNGVLVFDDIRQFGKANYYTEAPAGVKRLGPDALQVSFEHFFAELRTRKTRLKTLLLDQSFVSGIGNIYADEILFAAQIHPKARSNRLSQARARRLYDEMRRVLELAVAHRGSSISDYVDANGAPGSFQLQHRVYGRQNSACFRCGAAIRRIAVAQRGTHYCVVCQRA